METHAATDVFTPSTVARLTFVERTCITERVVNALTTPGRQLVVFGRSGCGKTTLVDNGAVATGRQVVQADAEMWNRIAEIEVPLVSGEEVEEIVAKGEQLLNVRFPDEIKASRPTSRSAASRGTWRSSAPPRRARCSSRIRRRGSTRSRPP